MALIGLSANNKLWIEVTAEGHTGKVHSLTTDAASPGKLRTSGLEVKDYISFSITHEQLIEALKMMRDGETWKHKVREFLKAKNYVSAIKEWRTHTGASLKAAKDAVDKMWREEGL